MTLLEADLTRGLTAGLDQLPAALGELRVRMLGLVEGLDDNAWRARSRRERWTVHDVVRHVRDVSHRLVARLQDDNAAEVPPVGVQPDVSLRVRHDVSLEVQPDV